MRQASNDNTETLVANARAEMASLEQTRDNLLERLANATLQNPARAEEYEAWVHPTIEAAKEAVDQLAETAKTAVSVIEAEAELESANAAVLFIFGEIAFIESISGLFVIVFNLVVKFYLNLSFRDNLKIFYLVCKCELKTIITKLRK
jgi:hypothetical protein